MVKPKNRFKNWLIKW